MVSFENFTMDNASPIYLQIIRHIKRGIAAGVICDGDEMPSRRMLSALLGINPNTVQKACRILEEEGIIISHGGAKSCISVDENAISRIRGELLRSDALSLLSSLKQVGLRKEEVFTLLEKLWDDEEGEL